MGCQYKLKGETIKGHRLGRLQFMQLIPLSSKTQMLNLILWRRVSYIEEGQSNNHYNPL